MKPHLTRRDFLSVAALGPVVGTVACRAPRGRAERPLEPPPQFLFVSEGRTGVMNADGSGLRYLEFDIPNQMTWQPAGFLGNDRRILLLSMEARRDGPGRAFAEFYTQTPTHLWSYDIDRSSLMEIATRERRAVFYTPQLVLKSDRMLVQVVKDNVGQVCSMNLDGSDTREFTRAGEGLPYGFSLRPDGGRVAFHLASPSGYQIWTSDVEGQDRTRIAGKSDHLYFGPQWSPAGGQLTYLDCLYRQDPAHDWSDIEINVPDGSEPQTLTKGQSHWFGATYGPAGHHGGGSNLVSWTRNGDLLFSRRLPGSKVPWEFQAQRVDTDHFNRDFKPEVSSGGSEICRLNPRDGSVMPLTRPGPGAWDFRASESPDGRFILFCRARTGGNPAVWVMDSDGQNPRQLTMGFQDLGADHPRWFPTRTGTDLRHST